MYRYSYSDSQGNRQLDLRAVFCSVQHSCSVAYRLYRLQDYAAAVVSQGQQLLFLRHQTVHAHRDKISHRAQSRGIGE